MRVFGSDSERLKEGLKSIVCVVLREEGKRKSSNCFDTISQSSCKTLKLILPTICCTNFNYFDIQVTGPALRHSRETLLPAT